MQRDTVPLQLNVPFDSHTMLNLWAQQYGAVYKVFVGHTPVVVVTGMCTSLPWLQQCAYIALTNTAAVDTLNQTITIASALMSSTISRHLDLQVD